MEFEPIELKRGDRVLVRFERHNWQLVEVVRAVCGLVATTACVLKMDQQGIAWHRIPRIGEAVRFYRTALSRWERGSVCELDGHQLGIVPEDGRGVVVRYLWEQFPGYVECAKAKIPTDDGPKKLDNEVIRAANRMWPVLWDSPTSGPFAVFEGAPPEPVVVDEADRAWQKRIEQAQSQAKASLDRKPMSETLGDLPQLPDLNCAYYIRVYDSYANNHKLKKLKVHEAKTSRSGERTLILEEE